jgi:hypothetical protein
LLIIVGIIVAVGGGYVAWRKLSKVTVSVVNGFDMPIKAKIGDKHVVVPAHEHVSVRVRCRPCQVVVTTESGVMIDRTKLDPSGEHVVFNPLGASTMANVGEMYNVHGLTSLEPKPSIEYFFERVVEPTGADYYFDAPHMIPKGNTKGTIEIRIFEQRMGWEATMLGLIERGERAEAKKLYETVVSIQGESAATSRVAGYLAENAPAQPAKRVKREDSWATMSADNEVGLYQQWNGTQCKLICQHFNADTLWTADECIAKQEDIRFVAPDCSRTIIVRDKGKVVSIYDQAALVETHNADEYGGRLSNVHLAADGHHVEFTTADNGTGQLLLYR